MVLREIFDSGQPDCGGGRYVHEEEAIREAARA
jgi:hypothetical protein